MVDLEEYLKLRERPAGPPAMYQNWRDLSFLHFSIDAHELKPLLPEDLSVDTFPDEAGRERAWIGLVPFWMRDIYASEVLLPSPASTRFPKPMFGPTFTEMDATLVCGSSVSKHQTELRARGRGSFLVCLITGQK